MQRILIAGCLMCSMSGSTAVAASSFPWLHTRPKPVLLDDQPPATPVVAQNRTPYHGTAAYPGSGRLYCADSNDRLQQQAQPSKSGFADFLLRGWRTNSQPAKPNPAKSK
jgi:hypothetical protein